MPWRLSFANEVIEKRARGLPHWNWSSCRLSRLDRVSEAKLGIRDPCNLCKAGQCLVVEDHEKRPKVRKNIEDVNQMELKTMPVSVFSIILL